MSRVGEKIRVLRSNLKMSQKQLGKKLGVSEKFIGDVESGRKIINQNLMDKLSKILGKDLNDLTMNFHEEKVKETKYDKASKNSNVKDVWNDAFSSVIKSVPVYDYELNKVLNVKKLPLISNKVEGYSKDKVAYIEIKDSDMIGFRIYKGDLAFAYLTHEIKNNSICLLQYQGKKVIRQIKKLDNSKLLLISNYKGLRTETVNIHDIKILAQLLKIEFKL